MKVQSLERAFDIIELLSENASGMNLSEISDTLSLPASTVYRIVNDLVERGYVHKEKTRNLYKIGLRFIDLSSQYLNNLELKTEARPYLAELCHQVNYSVFLAIMVEDDICYIDRLDPYKTSRGYSIIGQRRSLFSTSLGKSLILDHSDGEILELIEKKGIPQYTPYTITDPQKFLMEMHESRTRGWTSDNQEDRLDFQCVGVPIYDYRKKIIASISTSWDKSHFGTVDRGQIVQQVRNTAGMISEQFGYTERK